MFGTLHYFFARSCVLQKEIRYTSASAANLNFSVAPAADRGVSLAHSLAAQAYEKIRKDLRGGDKGEVLLRFRTTSRFRKSGFLKGYLNQMRTMHFVGHFSMAASQETPVFV